MVRTEICRRRLVSSRAIEHPAQSHAIHVAAMHAKAHDAMCALVRHDEHPLRAQHGRTATKHVETPQTVLRVTEDGEPGRPGRVLCGPVPSGENAPHDVLVNGNAEGQGDLLRDPWASPDRVPLFHVDDAR
jgi:hypothetical protein